MAQQVVHCTSARLRVGDRFGSWPATASYLKTLKIVPTAAMSGGQQLRGNPLARKQVQLVTMHSWDFSDKSRAIKGLVVCYLTFYLSIGVRVWHPITSGFSR